MYTPGRIFFRKGKSSRIEDIATSGTIVRLSRRGGGGGTGSSVFLQRSWRSAEGSVTERLFLVHSRASPCPNPRPSSWAWERAWQHHLGGQLLVGWVQRCLTKVDRRERMNQSHARRSMSYVERLTNPREVAAGGAAAGTGLGATRAARGTFEGSTTTSTLRGRPVYVEVRGPTGGGPK